MLSNVNGTQEGRECERNSLERGDEEGTHEPSDDGQLQFSLKILQTGCKPCLFQDT